MLSGMQRLTDIFHYIIQLRGRVFHYSDAVCTRLSFLREPGYEANRNVTRALHKLVVISSMYYDFSGLIFESAL